MLETSRCVVLSLSSSTIRIFRLRMDMPIYHSPQMWGPTVISMAYVCGVSMKVHNQEEERWKISEYVCAARSSRCIYSSFKWDV
jgi:hypothetical protein